MRHVFVTLLLLLGTSVMVHSLKCRSGFNASIAGVPLYQWYEDVCAAKSKCFGHEITVTVQDLDVVAQYGGCISAGYSSIISCESLFGQQSDLNPTNLLDIIPGEFDEKIQDFIEAFAKNLTANLQKLFTAGTNNQEFVAGLFKFYHNIGFNTKKLRPLEAPLGKLFSVTFSQMTDPKQLPTAINELFNAVSQLDTDNPGITADLYAFFSNIGADQSNIQNSPYSVLIEKIPGLFLSTLPASFEANRWYDEMFDLLSKVNPTNPVQTVKDMLVIIKATDWVPTDYKTYTDKFLDRLPELVSQLVAGNATYPGYWSTLLLMDYSEETSATAELSQAVISFFAKMGMDRLPGEVLMVIRYLPGHFYNYFPDKRAEIDKVYGKIADGFNSFDFSNLGDTKPANTMSDFLISFIDKLAPGTLDSSTKPFVINFSYTFYQLMEPDYNVELDTFFNTLTEGFKNYPTFNLGQIIQNLVVNLGGTVPAEVNPLLTNIQNLVNALVSKPDLGTAIRETKKIINAYKAAYPNSLFPAVFEDYIDNFVKLIAFNPTFKTPEQVKNFSLQTQLEAQYVAIDLHFAIVQVMNLTKKQIENLMTSAFPECGLFVKSLMILKPADVKHLVKNVGTWMFLGLRKDPPSLTSQGFVDAVKPAIQKLTETLGDVVKEYRRILSPNSCKSAFCERDNCNTNMKISSERPVKKAFLPSGMTSTTTSTPSSSTRITYSFVVIGSIIGIGRKLAGF